MSPRSKEQFEDIREQRKEQIFDVAIILFANKGYHATSISDIAKEAGMAKGLLYNYFESKEMLMREIMHKIINELFTGMDPNQDGILEKKELKDFIESIIKKIKKKNGFWQLLYSIMIQPSTQKIVTEEMMEHSMPMMELLIGFFKREKYKNPELETQAFHALLDGVILNYIMAPNLYPIDEMKKYIIEKYCK